MHRFQLGSTSRIFCNTTDYLNNATVNLNNKSMFLFSTTFSGLLLSGPPLYNKASSILIQSNLWFFGPNSDYKFCELQCETKFIGDLRLSGLVLRAAKNIRSRFETQLWRPATAGKSDVLKIFCLFWELCFFQNSNQLHTKVFGQIKKKKKIEKSWKHPRRWTSWKSN